MAEPNAAEPLKVFWQPGCTSCLRAKEFLNKHGVDYVSVNVMADPEGFAALAKLGIRTIPIVARGSEWVRGQILADVARIAGIQTFAPHTQLPPADIVARLTIVLSAAQGFAGEIPEDKLDTALPGRDQRPTATCRPICFRWRRLFSISPSMAPAWSSPPTSRVCRRA